MFSQRGRASSTSNPIPGALHADVRVEALGNHAVELGRMTRTELDRTLAPPDVAATTT